jgi:hypothetical protein
MAIMTSMFWTPNTTEAVTQLRENLLGFRNAARAAGWTCDVAGLIPGGGGVPGEMGLVIEYESGEAYGAAIDSPPPPQIVEFQQSMKSSDAHPERSATSIEIAGTEIPYGDLPKGIVDVAVIQPLPGKAAHAIADVQKSQKIMARLGIKARAMQLFLGNPAGMMTFIQFYENAAAWGAGADALGQDEEWQSHFGRSGDNRQIVRRSAYALEP